MGSIGIIKRPGVLGEEMVNIIRKHLSDCRLLVYSESDCEELLNESNLPELFILDLEFNKTHLKIIDYFIESKSKVITCIQHTNKTTPLLIKLFDRCLHGYFDFEMEVNELIGAIKKVLNGERYIHPNLSAVLLNEYIQIKTKKVERPTGVLTEREWEVLELIVQGKENDKIGQNLFISPTTVTNHVSSILRKLNVENRTSAASVAMKNRWITL